MVSNGIFGLLSIHRVLMLAQLFTLNSSICVWLRMMRDAIVSGSRTTFKRPPLEKFTPVIFVPNALKISKQGQRDASMVVARLQQFEMLISDSKSLAPRVKVVNLPLEQDSSSEPMPYSSPILRMNYYEELLILNALFPSFVRLYKISGASCEQLTPP